LDDSESDEEDPPPPSEPAKQTQQQSKSRSPFRDWFHRRVSSSKSKPETASNMSNTSGSVGAPNIYAAGDQRNPSKEEAKAQAPDRFQEGKAGSHVANDSKDERSIANKLARESQRKKESEQDDLETRASKQDSTLPAKLHGNEPSKGAKIDQELKEEEEAILAKKGIK